MADLEDKVESSEEEASEEEAPAQESESEDESAKKNKRKKKKGDDDEEWGSKAKKGSAAKKPAPAAAAEKKPAGGRGKKSAFTKSFKLSEELADVVGSDVMPRHEVVKKLWQVIKERNLQDPKNKQFAICDDQLLKVFGVKKFRTFGMMKHLKGHFLEAA